MNRILISLSALFAAIAPALLQAQTYHPVYISGSYNFSYYPGTGTPAGDVVLGGVLFHFPLSGLNSWDAYLAGGDGSDVRSNQFSVGVFGVKEVHTLLNTDWGTAEAPTLGLNSSGQREIITGKTSLRTSIFEIMICSQDWANQIDGTNAINVWDNGQPDPYHSVMDKQRIVLPTNFEAQTLTTIRLTDAGQENIQRLVLNGVTVVTANAPQVNLVKAVKPSFSSLSLGTDYQLQVSGDLNTWTNQGSVFTATNASMVYPQYWDVDNWNKLFFRLQAAH